MEVDRNIKVTIIVPVYNAEKTIINCAINLVNQTLKDIEIIFIDDCSQDNCYEILQQIKLQFPDIVKVYRTEINSGPGGARNVGLEHASGKYIGFVDSDDLADITMYEKLLAVAENTGTDIVDCGFISEEMQTVIMPIPDEYTGTLDDKKRNRLISKEGYIWCKIFKRELLERYSLRFRENVAMEDTDFILFVYAVADSLECVKEPLYKHTCNMESIMEKMTKYNNYCTVYKAMEAISERLSALSDYDSIRVGCEAMLINLYLCGIVNCLESELKNKEMLPLLIDLQKLKGKVVRGGYNNPFILKNINEQCITIMKLNDKKPWELIIKQ
ncbi:glycosyltransferase family 2 protein [[Clostridium] fimetarium]|uniref:Glycosyl transferase family 2 n=1 Tax=[Clostridium] fimetarium TaxID=99656 RepID=A0A1I0P4I2_9FIRM|nr:glycosyltransferase family 2 protein [[Clostridium] fimetarium]SEW09095.1 Glycosyl transferase family 2 [[Clostridium] fimetarium]